MNEAIARSNVFPGRFDSAISPDSSELNWVGRRLHEAGVIDMAPSTKPPGFYVNWTTVTSLIVVVTAIAGLWWFTWQTAEQRGIEKGRVAAEKEQQEKELDKMRQEIRLMEEKLKQQGGQ